MIFPRNNVIFTFFCQTVWILIEIIEKIIALLVEYTPYFRNDIEKERAENIERIFVQLCCALCLCLTEIQAIRLAANRLPGCRAACHWRTAPPPFGSTSPGRGRIFPAGDGRLGSHSGGVRLEGSLADADHKSKLARGPVASRRGAGGLGGG